MKRTFCLTIGIIGASVTAIAGLAQDGVARAASAATTVLASSATSASASRGKAIFMRCAACHATTADGPKKVGPTLAGVVGRKAGAVSNFRYSPAMKKSDVVWDRKQLDAFLVRPASVVPGTSMSLAGINDAKQRAALIDYLATLK